MPVSCELPYIEKSMITPPLKEELTKIHIKIMQDLLSLNGDKGSIFTPLFNKDRQKVIALFDENLYPYRRIEQLQALQDLNKKYKSVLNNLQSLYPYELSKTNQDIIVTRRLKLFDSANSKEKDVVMVNLGPYTLDVVPDEIDMSIYKDSMVEELFQNEYITKVSKILEELPSKSDLVLDQLESMFTELSAYKQNFLDSKEGSHEFPYLENKVKAIYYVLKSDDAALKLDRFTEIVKIGNNVLESILEKVQVTTKPLLDTLQRNDKDYNTNITKISKTLVEANDLLSVVLPLREILTNLKVQNGFSFWEDYNTFKVERDVMNLLDSEQRTKVSDILNNPEITNEVTLLSYIANALDIKYNDPLIQSIQKVLKDSSVGTNFISKDFTSILGNITTVQKDIKDMHYDLIAKIIFNQQLELENVDTYEEINDKKKDYLKSLEDIKKDLAVTTQDISHWNEWLASGADLNDQSARLLVSYVTEQITLGKLSNKNLAARIELKLKELDLSTTSEERKALDKLFVEDILYIENDAVLKEADEDYNGPTYEAFGKTFKVKKQKAFIQETNYAASSLKRKAHMHTLDSRVLSYFPILSKYVKNQPLSKEDLDKIDSEDLDYLIKSDFLYYKDDKLVVYKPKVFTKDFLKGKLNRGFYASNLDSRTPDEINKVLQEQYNKTHEGELDYAALLSVMNGPDSSFKRFLKYNTKRVLGITKNKFNSYELTRMLGYSFDPSDAYLKLIILNDKGEYQTLVLNQKDEYGNFFLPEEHQDKTFLALTRFYSEPSKILYRSRKYEKLQKMFETNEKAHNYYKFIKDIYSDANKKRGSFYQEYQLLPNIAKDDTATLKQMLTEKGVAADKINTWVKDLKYSDDTDGILYGWIDGERVYVNEKGEPVDEPVYYTLQDQYGDTSRELRPKYTRSLRNGQTVEDDLIVSMYMFGVSSNNYDSLKQVNSMVPVLKVLLKGDSTLGIDARRAYKYGSNKKKLASTADNLATVIAKNSTDALMSFMNSYALQLGNEDFSLLGLSAQKVSGLIKGLNAFQTLAWNATSALTNVSLGTLSNFLVAHGKKHGLTEQAIRDAYAEYSKNLPNFAVDFTKQTEFETSKYSQLAEYFDAVKGSYEDGRGTFEQKDLGSRFSRGALFFTSTLPEHMNQITLMIALLNTYEVAPATDTLPKLTMMDMVSHKPGEPIQFKTELLKDRGISEQKFEEEIKLRFFLTLSRMNQEAHGQYDSMDKNKLQRHAIFSLAWQFSKWMYSGYKARFRDEAYDVKSADLLDEGYFKTYLKFLTKDIKEATDELEGLNFLDTVKNYMSMKGLKTVAQVAPQFIFKQILGAADRIPSLVGLGKLMPSKQFEKLDEWLYGDKLDKRRTQIMRANLELSVFLAAYLLGLGLHALADDEDDEVKKKLLQGVELQAKRLYNDIGFYAYFTNPFIIADRVRQKMKDPLSVMRMYDNNLSLISQLVWGEFKDGEFNFYINDQYEKSGKGYEKGDYKLERKIMKTALAPVYQTLRFLDPEQQISFLNMVYKNS